MTSVSDNAIIIGILAVGIFLGTTIMGIILDPLVLTHHSSRARCLKKNPLDVDSLPNLR